jgi:SSS family solute:Na+ symporter
MNTIALLTFLTITMGVALLSWIKTRKEQLNTLSGLFFANRNLGFIAVGCGLLFANINTALFIGENELTYINNMSVMAWGVTSVFAMLAVSEFIIPVYLKVGIATTPDFLAIRYDHQTKTIVTFIFLLNYIINLLPSVLYSGAVAFNGLFHFSDYYQIDYWSTIWILVWIMGSIGGLYSFLGGLKAITVSDVLLGIGLYTGGLLLPFFALQQLGQGSIGEGLHKVLSSNTSHLNSIGSSRDAIPFGTLFTGMLLVNLYYWGTEQYIVQQVLGSRNLANCQKGIALACLGKLLLPLLINIPGIIAVHIYASMPNSVEVFPRLVSDVSSPLYSGFMAALLFGAALTTFNAGLNSSGTLFTLNIYKPLAIKRNWSLDEKDCLRVAKRFEFILCIVAMFIAPFIMFAKGGLYTYLQKIGGLFSVPIFTILIVGLLTKKVPALAAKIGLLFFVVAYTCTQMVFDVKLHFLHVLAILFVVTTGIMLAIGRWRPMAVPFQLPENSLVDIKPWKNRHFYTVLLVIMAVLLFVLFSPLVLVK